MNVEVVKTVPIKYEWVLQSYKKVRRGGKAAGIDQESWVDFDKNVEKNLYVIWNRLASGSYHPQAVRSVEIPKKDGSMRNLGIPTLRDRISQEVVKTYMEDRIDMKFHKNSYGYRPLKSAHQALRAVKDNCYGYDWVIDMDISKFFDEIDHELMMLAVEKVMPEKWVHTYVRRWLEMPIQDEKGEIHQKNGKGTPQGGVISPLLSNLYLHFTLDKWFEKNHPEISFVRYADDVVVHCKSKQQAEAVLKSIKTRLGQTKLSIKESKTKIAYCKDYRRNQKVENVSFDYLGYSFKPIKIIKGKSVFLGFGGVMSKTNQKKINTELRNNKQLRSTEIELEVISKSLNPKLRGWINYYSLFGKASLYKVLKRLDSRILKWVMKKFRLYTKKAIQKIQEIKRVNPKLFYHWEKGITAF
jgi:RNA-directed DNA polymerase